MSYTNYKQSLGDFDLLIGEIVNFLVTYSERLASSAIARDVFAVYRELLQARHIYSLLKAVRAAHQICGYFRPCNNAF